MHPRRTLLAKGLSALAVLWAASASATPSLYSTNCTLCHSATVTTCNGCHAHGTHSNSSKSDINVAGTLNKTSFAPGETVSVTVGGGYRAGWVRILLFDQNGTELARSSCPGGMGGCTTSSFPQTLSAPAPTTPGAYTWWVAWYGNQFDATGASFGQGTSATLQPGSFTPDPSNSGHGFQTVALQPFTVAAPAAPSISLSPSSLSFPTVTLGGSAQRTTQIQNTGTAPLSVTAISRCAGTTAVFTWSPAAPLAVPAGGSTTLTVTYTPLVAGTDTGCLTLASNDPANPSVELGLSGTAVAPTAPAIALSPPSLAFGNVMVGGSGSLATEVRNTGTATLEVTSIARCSGTSTEFAWSPAAPFGVPPGGSAMVTVTYDPVDVGADAGCLAFTSNAPTSPTELNLSGAGTAVPAPNLALDPAALDFGSVLLGSTATLPVQVRNTGTAALTVLSIDRCSGTSTAFGWSPAAPFEVMAGGSVTLEVTYAPVLAGADTGCLALSSTDPDQPIVELGLAGSGVAEATPSLALVPSALDFGAVTLGSTASRTTEVQNAGGAALEVTAIARCEGTSAAYDWSPPAPFTVGAGMTQTLTVTYAPTAAQTDDGCLAVSSNDPLNPITNLALSGAGVEAPVAGLDIDIARFTVRPKVKTRRDREIVPRITATNEGSVDGTALATVVGTLGGTEIYRQSISIPLAVGKGGSFDLPPHLVPAGAMGVIQWTAVLEDEDPDVDQATAMTSLFDGGPSAGRAGASGSAFAAEAAVAGCNSGGGSAGSWTFALLAMAALAARSRYGRKSG